MIFRLSTCERKCPAAPLCCQWPTKCVSQFLVNNFPFLSDHTHAQLWVCECVFIVPVDDSLVDCFIYVACAHVLTVHAHNAHLHIELSHALHTNTHTQTALQPAPSCGSCIVIATFAAAVAQPQLCQLLQVAVQQWTARVAAATATGSATWLCGNNMSLKQCSSCALNYQRDAPHTHTAGCLTIGPVILEAATTLWRSMLVMATGIDYAPKAIYGLWWCKKEKPH